ncbi:hypothetical protein PFISCL1PPCAC_5291, partial [Pristionchus fissidentatus]
LISAEFRMSDSSMALIPLLALVPLVVSMVLCGKKKEIVKKEEKKPVRYPGRFGDCPDNGETVDDGTKSDWGKSYKDRIMMKTAIEKTEPADNPMPEADALELVEAIKKGLVRPQKDDESIDDHKTDWGKTQMTGKVGQTGPGTGTEGGLQWKKKN